MCLNKSIHRSRITHNAQVGDEGAKSCKVSEKKNGAATKKKETTEQEKKIRVKINEKEQRYI